MAQVTASQQWNTQPGPGTTQRTDRWWVEPLLVVITLGLFGVYLTVAAAIGRDFEAGPYLSPLYEPLIRPGWLPGWISPAFLILWAPGGFRATCYYYRRAYYRSFFFSPPACAVQGVAPGKYPGERGPLLVQNLHRYFMYVALVFNIFLWWGTLKAFRYEGEFGVGVGSIIMTLNAFLLMMYTFSCHSLRHFIGGSLNCFSCSVGSRARKRVWDLATVWNEHHRFWAWTSLIVVGSTDLYIRLVATGTITDLNTWSAF
ncbi:MAG: succinate dehydrogenase [Dehalococcoidia bacterium]|nr:succinate dehydrogenase [Dehalococcoidia bacterium]